MAPVASAQDDQVFVDPDSPSGREYELPIDSARRQGAAGSQTKEPAAGAQGAPLFGAGVEADSADDGTVAGSSTSGRARDGGAGSESAGPEARTAPATAARKAQAAAPGGADGLVAIIGIGTGVLLAGVLGGLLLRRRAAR